jgi:hypothetical protein
MSSAVERLRSEFPFVIAKNETALQALASGRVAMAFHNTDERAKAMLALCVEARVELRRLQDAEMIARAATSHVGTSLLTRRGDGSFWLNFTNGMLGIPLEDDGTGLPLLTDAARAALRLEAGE